MYTGPLLEPLDALDFDVSRDRRESLYLQGYEAATRYLANQSSKVGQVRRAEI